jgi:putative RNA 2'-phosphotransferase
MTEKQIKGISKFLSYILRHNPQSIGLKLDKEGWADVNELMEKSKTDYNTLTKELLDIVVSTNEKKRFAFNEDGSKIRASQGHSIDIELKLETQQPPEFLYHGTVEGFLENIKTEGLKKMNRQYVHLSADKDTAFNVGSRRGKPVILAINSGRMHQDGYSFYFSANGVWLTDHVPVQFISLYL